LGSVNKLCNRIRRIEDAIAHLDEVLGRIGGL
jgi:hypothetical protein